MPVVSEFYWKTKERIPHYEPRHKLKPALYACSLCLFLMTGCQHASEETRPQKEQQKNEIQEQSLLPKPTPTYTIEEEKYGRIPPHRPTPPPLALNGYGAEPNILFRDREPSETQVVVSLNQIYYQSITKDSVQFKLPDSHFSKKINVEITYVELFEAQDLLIGVKVNGETQAGTYDLFLKLQ